ncbi:hypothetical protein PpBr36_00692 [Pyricularia pennisetigena]|uniref:hypothetical protein n=1 Tax=Pyricularia pennisetigena TaxID=1578925 RepID=UPI001154A97D|nr:hypothetical protein PpBr36_00692 [Pyricularia pennisetigena]TLS28950.1 hypothetical protein PpBr36_00692 [Pyricularia pennisetigena]
MKKPHNGEMPTRYLSSGTQILAAYDASNEPQKHKDKVSIYLPCFFHSGDGPGPRSLRLSIYAAVWEIVRYSRWSERHGPVAISSTFHEGRSGDV